MLYIIVVMEVLKINNFFIKENDINHLLEVAKANTVYCSQGTNSKCFFYDGYVILKTSNIRGDNNDFDLVIKRLHQLKQDGVNVVPILGYAITGYGKPYSDGERYDKGYIIQEKAPGEEVFNRKFISCREFLTDEQKKYVLKKSSLMANAPQQHYDKWVNDFKAISDAGIEIDPSKLTNFFYDEAKGFSFIDLNFISRDNVFTNPDLYGKQTHRSFIRYCFLPIVAIPLKNYNDASVYSADEEKLIINSAVITYSKLYSSLLKMGIPEQDIEDAFVDQKTDTVYYSGFSLYGFKSSQEILDYKRTKLDNDNNPCL